MAIFGKAWFNDEASVDYVRGFGSTLVAYVDHWGSSGRASCSSWISRRARRCSSSASRTSTSILQPALGQSSVYYTSLDGMLVRAPGGRVPAPQGQRFLAIQTAGPTLLSAVGTVTASPAWSVSTR